MNIVVEHIMVYIYIYMNIVVEYIMVYIYI